LPVKIVNARVNTGDFFWIEFQGFGQVLGGEIGVRDYAAGIFHLLSPFLLPVPYLFPAGEEIRVMEERNVVDREDVLIRILEGENVEMWAEENVGRHELIYFGEFQEMIYGVKESVGDAEIEPGALVLLGQIGLLQIAAKGVGEKNVSFFRCFREHVLHEQFHVSRHATREMSIERADVYKYSHPSPFKD
jgi:hypothetical protein